jgi:hypothetical protein
LVALNCIAFNQTRTFDVYSTTIAPSEVIRDQIVFDEDLARTWAAKGDSTATRVAVLIA